MAKNKKVSLCWYAKTPAGWRYFEAIIDEPHKGFKQARHGWVEEKGELKEYPQGRYVLRSFEGGKKIYKPLDTCHPRDAYLAWTKAQGALSKTTALLRDPKKVVKTAIPAYIKDCEQRQAFDPAENAKLVLGEFVKHTSDVMFVSAITKEMLYRYHAALRKGDASDRTIANKDARVRSWLRFCGYDTKTLPPRPKFEEPVPEIYTPGQVKAVLESADEYMGIAIRMALMLGLREQEVMYAEWADIDWHHATFRVQGKIRSDWKFAVKDKAQRELPIPQELLTLLKEWQKKRPKTALIIGNDKDKPEGHLLRKLKQAARKSGLNCGQCEGCQARKECERWFLHKFRATYCTRMLRQTDAKTVQELAGHSDLETTLRYLAPASGAELQAHANAIKWTE